MTNETKLPDGLQLAERLIGVARDHAIFNEQREQCGVAIDAIRAEHDQRLTLQHHAADLAQRVADLEAERDRLQHDRHRVRADAQARVDAAVLRALAAEQMRDELRARLDASNADAATAWARHENANRLQVSLQMDNADLRKRLAEMDACYAHDAVWEALQRMIEDGQTKGPASREDALTVARHRDRVRLLAARPVPAVPDESFNCDVCGVACEDPWHYSAGDQRHMHACDACWPGVSPAAPATPTGWKLVKSGALAMVVNALRRDAEDGRPVRGEMADELLAAAPEAAR
jgi:hypothetical protein